MEMQATFSCRRSTLSRGCFHKKAATDMANRPPKEKPTKMKDKNELYPVVKVSRKNMCDYCIRGSTKNVTCKYDPVSIMHQTNKESQGDPLTLDSDT